MRPILLFSFALLVQSSISQEKVLTIFFEKNSSEISANYADQLSALRKKLYDDEIALKAINSFCDTIGTTDYNKKLSERRLSSVLKNLQLLPRNNFKAWGEDITFAANLYKPEDYRRVDIIYIDRLPPPPDEGKSKAKKQELASILTATEAQSTVNFNFEFTSRTAILANPEDPELNELVDFLKANPTIKAHIRGHVCCSDNQLISEQRAEAIYQYLVYSDVSRQQLSFRGYSNTFPIVSPEITEEDQQKNRRVDIIFSK